MVLWWLWLVGCVSSPVDSGEVAPIPGTPAGTTVGTPWTPPDVGTTRAVHDEDFLPAAIAAVGAATDRVRVAQYLLYDGPGVDELVAAIGAAAARGVRVQVLADQEGPETEDVLVGLAISGAETAFDSRRTTLHTKLIVADDVVLVGSHNFSSSALQSNHEGSVLVNEAAVAGWYADWFDQLWAAPDSDPVVSPMTGPHVPLADRMVLDALVGCMDGATERVDLVLYALAWDDRYPGGEIDRLLTALEGAHGRGLAVDVVLDGSDWIASNQINDAAIARLEATGIDVRRTPRGTTTHAKVLRCDDRVIVGDANWSYSSMALFHGTSLQSDDPVVVAGTEAWMAAVGLEAQ